MTARNSPVIIILLLIAAGVLAVPAASMINPAASYCTELGYPYRVSTAADGSMTGSCDLPGNRSVDAWQFLQGKVSPELGYCTKQGLGVRTVNDPAVCGMLGSTCAVCVSPDGTTREVTSVMGLDFREKICSGAICCDPAQDRTCPIGREEAGGGEPGSQPIDRTLVVLAAIIAVIVMAGIVWFLTRKKGSGPEEKKP